MKPRSLIVLLSIVFSLLIPSLAEAASYILSGKVTDKDGEPVALATIAVKKAHRGTQTDESGRYSITLKPGSHEVEASCVGYDPVTKKVSLTADTSCDFTLTPNSTGLQEVRVMGKSAARKLQEGALAVNAVEIRNQANRVTTLNDIVDRSSGVKVRREGGVGSDLDLSINGLSGNSIRYFIDGVPLTTKGGEVNLDHIPLSTVDRVELYKGVVPSYLGADALGGAVNIVSKRNRENFIDASYGAGSFHTQMADLSAQWFIPKTAVAIRPQVGFTSSKNDYKMKNVEVWSEEESKFVKVTRRRFHDDYSSLYAQIEAGVNDVKWADAFFVSGSYTKIDKEIQTGAMQTKVYGEARRKAHAWGIGMRYAKRFGNLSTRLNVNHTWDHSTTIDTAFRKYNWDGSWIPASGNEMTNRSRMMRVYKRPFTSVNAGVSYDINPYHNIAFDYNLNRRGNDRSDKFDKTFEPSSDNIIKHILALTYTQSLFSSKWQNTFFVKDYINHTHVGQSDWPSISGADKVKKDDTKSYWGAGLGTLYTFSPLIAAKGSYEHSVRLPLARELLGNGTTVYPNLTLSPEESNNYNIGAYGTWWVNADNMLTYEANGFLRHVQNYIRAVVSERDGVMQYVNQPAVEIKGIDFRIAYSWRDALRLTVNGTWNDARDLKRYKSDGNPSATYKNRVPNRPWLFGNIEASYIWRNLFHHDDYLSVTIPFQWIHWYYLNWEVYGYAKTKARIPEQKIIDLEIAYSWHSDRYTISLECDNIFNALAYDNYMLQKPGRSFSAKFRIFFK